MATTVATKPTQCTDESTGRVTSRGWDERDDLLKFVYGEAFRTRECEMLREGPIDDGSLDNL